MDATEIKKLEKRYELLGAKLNALTFNCPLRYSVAIRDEMKQIKKLIEA